MKSLVSCSRECGVKLLALLSDLLTSSIYLHHICDPHHYTDVAVAKAISDLLHDQSNKILLAFSRHFYSTGNRRLQTSSFAFVKIRSLGFFLGLQVTLSYFLRLLLFHSLFDVVISQTRSSTISSSYSASLGYLI